MLLVVVGMCGDGGGSCGGSDDGAPLGRVGLRVTMSVCLSVCLFVCLSAPSGAVFSKACAGCSYQNCFDT